MRAAALWLAAVAATAPTLHAEEDYAIRLAHLTKVGARYHVDSKGKNREQVRSTVNGKTEKSEKLLTVHMIALATVLAVDTKSEAIRTEYEIESCRKAESGTSADAVPAGSKVTAEYRDGKTVFRIDGQPASKETAEALGIVIQGHKPDSATDDEVFGTLERKRVGDQWKINAAVAASDWSERGFVLSEEDIKGFVRLNGVTTVSGSQALDISAHLRADGIRKPLPEGMRIEKAFLEADFGGLFPVDNRRRLALSDKTQGQVYILMTAEKPDTKDKVTLELSMEASLESSYSPVKESTNSRPAANR